MFSWGLKKDKKDVGVNKRVARYGGMAYYGGMSDLIKRTFRITKDNDRNLKKWAKAEKVSESEIVRRALLITKASTK